MGGNTPRRPGRLGMIASCTRENCRHVPSSTTCTGASTSCTREIARATVLGIPEGVLRARPLPLRVEPGCDLATDELHTRELPPLPGSNSVLALQTAPRRSCRLGMIASCIREIGRAVSALSKATFGCGAPSTSRVEPASDPMMPSCTREGCRQY